MRFEFTTKKCLLIMAVPLLLFSCGSKVPDYFYGNLTCPAKEIVVKEYYAEKKYGEWVPGELFSHSKTVFNEKDGVVEYFEYDKTEGNLKEYTRRIKEKKSRFVLFNNDTIFDETILISEDKNAKTKIFTRTIGDEVSTDTIREVREGDVLTTYMSSGNRFIEEYKDGKVIEAASYNDDGKLLHKDFYKYNKDGLIVENKFYSTISNDTTTYIYEYLEFDDKGNWTKLLEYKDWKKYDYITDREKITTREITY
ncbi:MAG: hypothetical protein GX963_10035 [Bacteroidales bacterium]|nr:hypothetical protein [Bacteroidales bacterium]